VSRKNAGWESHRYLCFPPRKTIRLLLRSPVWHGEAATPLHAKAHPPPGHPHLPALRLTAAFTADTPGWVGGREGGGWMSARSRYKVHGTSVQGRAQSWQRHHTPTPCFGIVMTGLRRGKGTPAAGICRRSSRPTETDKARCLAALGEIFAVSVSRW
jgi:hypothetical protein